ncbi:GNAT family N-acetyltransferase [Microbacterium sp.]|uniref:GNAT family N-acetyltransferase n=1 Tax=Microbacterium sp. TaxID=51671 RepID=UPI0039E22361
MRWTVEDGVSHVERLTIAPDMQGRGLGTRLLRAAEEASGVASFELFTGRTSEGYISLYRREGYVLTRRERLSETRRTRLPAQARRAAKQPTGLTS